MAGTNHFKTLTYCAVSLFLAAGFFPGNAFGVQVVPVQATVVDETVVLGSATAVEGKARGMNTLPENLDSYLPKPMPEMTESAQAALEVPLINKVVTFNAETGEENVLDAAEQTSAALGLTESEASFGIPANLENEGVAPTSFYALTRITNPQVHPYRVSAKMYFSQGGSNYVCSATLIKPNFAITAGHCVHDGPGGAGWSRNVVIVPGYKGSGDRPYGGANGIRLLTWTGWANSGSFNHDIGVIKLDRNIGSATGWHGYGWTSSPGFYVSSTSFNNQSYPAESPYNGEYMYHRYGKFDGWYALMLQVWHNPRAWGGQSGSSYYRSSSAGRHVYAITSNKNVSANRTGAPIITSGKFNDIQNFVRTASPALDLVPSFVKVNQQGGAVRKMSYLVSNNSNQYWSGTVTAKVYLSDNASISTADTLIQQHEFEASFTPLSSVLVSVPSVAFPAVAPAGKQYVGVILDLSDADPTNNNTDGQDAAEVNVP